MIKSLALLLLAIVSPLPSFAQEEANGYMQITIEYVSMFPGNLQVRDEICRQPRSVECEKNSIKLMSDKCRQNPMLKECKEARMLAESSSCVEGLLFDGRVSRGETIKAWICVSYGGYGNVSVRDLKNSVSWTNYSLMNDGDAIRFP